MSIYRLCSKTHAVHVLSRSMEELEHCGVFYVYEKEGKREVLVGRYPCLNAKDDSEDGIVLHCIPMNNVYRRVTVTRVAYHLRDVPIAEETYDGGIIPFIWEEGKSTTFYMELTYAMKRAMPR